jgi:hypothetical protein
VIRVAAHGGCHTIMYRYQQGAGIGAVMWASPPDMQSRHKRSKSLKNMARSKQNQNNFKRTSDTVNYLGDI